MVALLHECDHDCREYKGRDHPLGWSVLEWTFYRCPIETLPEETFLWLKAYRFFKNGFFPNPGGWLNQPKRYIEIIDFLETSIAGMNSNGRERTDNSSETR